MQYCTVISAVYLSLAVIIMNPLMAVLLLRADHLYPDVILCPIWTAEC